MAYTPPNPTSVNLTLASPAPTGADLVLGATQGPQPYTPPAHNNVLLVLDQPVPDNADLVLGATGDAAPEQTFDGTLQGRFALRAALGVVTIFEGTVQGQVAAAGVLADVAVGYDNAVMRGVHPAISAAFNPHSTTKHGRLAAAWVPSAALPVANMAEFNEGAAQVYVVGLGWAPVKPAHPATALPLQEGAPAAVASEAQWGLGAATPASTVLPAANAQPAGNSTLFDHAQGAATHRQRVSPWGLAATPTHRHTTAPHHRAALRQTLATTAPWQVGRHTTSVGGPWAPYKPPVVPPVPASPDLRLCQLLSELGHTPFAVNLVLGVDPCANTPQQPGAQLFILPARFYMAVHSIEAHLLPDETPVPIFGVSLSADSGSFAWTFSAQGPASLFDLLAPSGGLPPSIRITLDGLQWVFVVDSLAATESFGQRGARISGRSATALVGSPYARETARLNTTAQNAQQLATAALDLSGVGLDWGIDDWLVPAGAWSHTGTPLAAVQALAEAAGGYVQSHRNAPTLLVRHPYPTLPDGTPGGPWNWGLGNADVELAPSAIITSSIERRDGPDVDGVYVSGTSQGVLAHVKRTGTAGAKLAAMVADPLITANIAAQQRGLSVLGAAGPKHLVQISLPVLTGASQPGVLDVGQLVQVNETAPWRGRVRSVSVQATMPSVRQTISLEQHL